ncbi:phenylacetate--CoA ligase family protein [Streptomyces sp. NBC_01304]|uniref:phenylacetate--CoA ligase family protein n=1 Tax=Streptomyces sp. NBC_01304 TaxID=2903818 RepID=UPI002E1514D0|nr:AMP-binding protein [Streptomyces sp. NBC_01304]
MFDAGIRQFRLAWAMVLGRPINVRSAEKLVADALATLAEFGSPGEDVEQLLRGASADPQMRTDLTNKAVRRTAKRLAAKSAFYAEQFKAAGIDPATLDIDNITAVPVTTKTDLVKRADDFLCSEPFLASRTTGTTGRPAEVWYSAYEERLWPALVALSQILRGNVRTTDLMQFNVSSRATGTSYAEMQVARLAGAAIRMVGLVPPAETLDLMTGTDASAPTLMVTYPSYLGRLITEARERGLGPDDFRLRAINVGSEVLSPALAKAAADTFGARINDGYGMTELTPMAGAICRQQHLHIDSSIGLVEVCDLETGERAEPGALGTIVATPFYPYRECMPLFRYDTRDLVRRLPDGPLDCEMANVPATSHVLGKADHVLRTADGVVTPRDVIEVLDALPGVQWPVRHRATVVDGKLRIELPRSQSGDWDRADVIARFAAAGMDTDLDIVDVDGRELRRYRCDLTESSFTRRTA